MLKDCDTRCFVQVSRVVHAHVFVHMHRSSMHGCLYTCLRTVTLAVVFKCLESFMHMCLYICIGRRCMGVFTHA
jgi:hypothetical protein